MIGAWRSLRPREVQEIDVYHSPELTVGLVKVVYRSLEPMVDLVIAFFRRHQVLHTVKATDLGCTVLNLLSSEVGTHFRNPVVVPVVVGPSSPPL